jgi:hypothetical protein
MRSFDRYVQISPHVGAKNKYQRSGRLYVAESLYTHVSKYTIGVPCGTPMLILMNCFSLHCSIMLLRLRPYKSLGTLAKKTYSLFIVSYPDSAMIFTRFPGLMVKFPSLMLFFMCLS